MSSSSYVHSVKARGSTQLVLLHHDLLHHLHIGVRQFCNTMSSLLHHLLPVRLLHPSLPEHLLLLLLHEVSLGFLNLFKEVFRLLAMRVVDLLRKVRANLIQIKVVDDLLKDEWVVVLLFLCQESLVPWCHHELLSNLELSSLSSVLLLLLPLFNLPHQLL